MEVILEPIEFDWDEGNSGKNSKKHGVADTECEEVFFDENKVVYKDQLHTEQEDRFILLGKTKDSRLLYVVFTFRYGSKVRVISARDVERKEVHLYEKGT